MSHHVIDDVTDKRNATSIEGNQLIKIYLIEYKKEKSKKSACPEYHPSHGWQWMPHHLSEKELWLRIRAEAKQDAVISHFI